MGRIASRIQRILAISAFEAEYIALFETMKQAEYTRKVLYCFGYPQKATTIFVDNSSAILKANSQMIPKASRHIQLRLDWIEYLVNQGSFEALKIGTEKNHADYLNKPKAKDDAEPFYAFVQAA